VRVFLDTKKKKILVSDNGRGMDWAGLRNFFVMHGENQDRKLGRIGRGRFGTGKSAAFGIANSLRITTIRHNKRSVVELNRRDVVAVESGDEIPVHIIEKEVPTGEPNGTTVEIRQVQLKSLDQKGIINYVERHLARWPKNVTVFVNNHKCEVDEPPVAWERRFTASEPFCSKLGDVELVVRVSKVPLDQDRRGVSIYSNGVWHETTLVGSETKELSQYIFGEIDVPKLEEDSSPISPFDLSRSMQLNPSNELVRAAYAFVSSGIEQVRRELVEHERDRKATEEARRLEEQASEIAKVINEDFQDFRNSVAKVRARGPGAHDLFRSELSVGHSEGDLLPGSVVPAEVLANLGNPGARGTGRNNGDEPRNLMPQVAAAGMDAQLLGQNSGGSGNRRGSTGGFHVKFEQMGPESHRAKYLAERRTIYLNLDHPQLAAAKGLGPVDEPSFRRLACEVAFCEYAVALHTELASQEGYYRDFFDPLVELRLTLNRLARRGAQLYSA
jgi:hypothetical protein